jgi:class 3 adenylate cyclase/pimeloyl-ACP methyl ester carboxylesterase
VPLAPKTEFVLRGSAHLAYQVVGDGPANVLQVSGVPSHREEIWRLPLLARGQERVARLARVAQYDARGMGMSDALPDGEYPIEEAAADALAVLDAAGFERAVMWGQAVGGAVAIWLAVHHPDRTAGLLLDNATARVRAAPGYDIGLTDGEVDARRVFLESSWGSGASIGLIASELAEDERTREEWARYERLAATPSGILASDTVALGIDARDLLAEVATPTLVLHSATNAFVPVSHGRYLSEHIPAARYVEVEGNWHVEFRDSVAGADLAEFLTGSRARAHVYRSLVVVLFTDIAGSTDHVAAIGDIAWRDVLENFRGLVRRTLDRHDAHEVNTRGDDFFAVVAAPSVAIDIARSIRSEAADLGLSVRTGLHLGEVEQQDDDYAGLAVHIGARIGALAAAGEILVSHAVRDALIGSAITFSPRGPHALKGVPGEWGVFVLEPDGRS